MLLSCAIDLKFVLTIIPMFSCKTVLYLKYLHVLLNLRVQSGDYSDNRLVSAIDERQAQWGTWNLK